MERPPRQFRVSYTIIGQILQKIIVQASDANAAIAVVKAMFGNKIIIGYVEEIKNW